MCFLPRFLTPFRGRIISLRGVIHAVPSQHYMQIRVNFAHGGGPLGRGDTSKWRHGIPWSSIPCSRARLALVPRVSTVFSLLVCGSPYRVLFFPSNPLSSGSSPLTFALPLVPGLRRRSLPYPRLFNSRAWARAYRSVLLRLVKLTLNARRSSFPPPFFRVDFSLTRCTRTPKSTRAFKALTIAWPLGS